jgi:hypothetical protein
MREPSVSAKTSGQDLSTSGTYFAMTGRRGDIAEAVHVVSWGDRPSRLANRRRCPALFSSRFRRAARGDSGDFTPGARSKVRGASFESGRAVRRLFDAAARPGGTLRRGDARRVHRAHRRIQCLPCVRPGRWRGQGHRSHERLSASSWRLWPSRFCASNCRCAACSEVFSPSVLAAS